MASVVVGYSNGIICLVDATYTFFYLWNPLLNKIVKQRIQRSFRGDIVLLGYGYDFSNNHCAIVCVFKDVMTDQVVGAKLYTVYGIGNTNKWRIFSINPPSQFLRFPNLRNHASVYVNKALHWLVEEESCNIDSSSILSFHIEDHVFQKLDLPSLPRPSMDSILIEFNGKLCVCERHMSLYEPFTIWIMKEYGKSESWVPFLHIDSISLEFLNDKYEFDSLRMVGLKNGEEIWVQRYYDNGPSVLNPYTLELRHMEIKSESHYSISGTYMESLALMDVVEDGECVTVPISNNKLALEN